MGIVSESNGRLQQTASCAASSKVFGLERDDGACRESFLRISRPRAFSSASSRFRLIPRAEVTSGEQKDRTVNRFVVGWYDDLTSVGGLGDDMQSIFGEWPVQHMENF